MGVEMVFNESKSLAKSWRKTRLGDNLYLCLPTERSECICDPDVQDPVPDPNCQGGLQWLSQWLDSKCISSQSPQIDQLSAPIRARFAQFVGSNQIPWCHYPQSPLQLKCACRSELKSRGLGAQIDATANTCAPGLIRNSDNEVLHGWSKVIQKEDGRKPSRR